MPITSVALQDAELTDVLLRFEKDDQGKEKQCIVYFSSVRKTVDAARDFAANRVAKTENAELIELAKDIKNEVHNDYYLAELVSKGVAYHIGYLPASIRQRIERLFHEGAITAIFCTSTLVEGVNLPADNLFITDFKNGLSHMSAIDFRNLIGRVGRLEYNLYGNVFLVAINEKASEKYVSRLQEEIPEQSLSVEKELTRPQKKHVIKTLLSGTIVIDKQLKSQSPDSYDLMRKFAIILLNDSGVNEEKVKEVDAQQTEKERYSGKLPVEGMPVRCLKYTTLGVPDKRLDCKNFDKLELGQKYFNVYWYDENGEIIAAGMCAQWKNDSEFMLKSFSQYNPGQKGETQTTDSGNSSDTGPGSGSSLREDYDDPEDLYEDGDYEDLDEAWDEWEEGW